VINTGPGKPVKIPSWRKALYKSGNRGDLLRFHAKCELNLLQDHVFVSNTIVKRGTLVKHVHVNN